MTSVHRPFRFSTGYLGKSPQEWVALAHRAEELGYCTLLLADRPPLGRLAPLTSLAVAAMATTSLHVGTSVLVNDYRHPVLVAAEVATLDLFSQGRLELGLGAGNWSDDYEQMGIPCESPGTRIARLEEAIAVLKQMWTGELVNFSGTYYTIKGVQGLTSFRQPHPLLYIGGAGKRLLQLAGREADIVHIGARLSTQGFDPTDATPEALARKVAWVREAAGERFASLELCMVRCPLPAHLLFDMRAETVSKEYSMRTHHYTYPVRLNKEAREMAHFLRTLEEFHQTLFFFRGEVLFSFGKQPT